MNRQDLLTLLAPYLPQVADLSAQDDLFEAGLDSFKTFLLLDDLAEAGQQIEFTELVANPSLAFLLEKTGGSWN